MLFLAGKGESARRSYGPLFLHPYASLRRLRNDLWAVELARRRHAASDCLRVAEISYVAECMCAFRFRS